MSTVPKREMTIRRRFRVLMRREAWLAERIAGVRAAGAGNHFAAECSSIHWALEELAWLYPENAANARRDHERDEERRHERRGLISAASGGAKE